jgi:hypothetical protein
MNIVFLCIFIISTLAGVAFFLYAWWHFRDLTSNPAVINELTYKIFAKSLLTLAGFSLVYPDVFLRGDPRYDSPTFKEEWLWVKMIGLLTCGIWELLTLYLDNKNKKAAEQNKASSTEELQRAEELRLAAEEQAGWYGLLLSAIESHVEARLKDFYKVMESEQKQQTFSTFLKRALKPEESLDRLFASLAELLSSLSSDDPAKVNIRIGLFVDRKDRLEIQHFYDKNDAGRNSSQSATKYPEAFRMENNAKPTMAVRCIRGKESIFIPDTHTAAETDFYFLHEDQKRYLCSTAALSIGSVCIGWNRFAQAAIVLDSNERELFANKDEVELILKEFKNRLKLELVLLACQTGGGRS